MKKRNESFGNNPVRQVAMNLAPEGIKSTGMPLGGRAYLLRWAAALASLGYIASVHAQSIDDGAKQAAGNKPVLGGSARATAAAGAPAGQPGHKLAAVDVHAIRRAGMGDTSSRMDRQMNGAALATADDEAPDVPSLKVLQETAGQTHYYSVNDNGVQGGNYANDGATGANALAAGWGAQASGAGSVAVGQNSSTANDHDVAIGPEAGTQGSVGSNVAIGFGAKAVSSMAQGDSIAIGHMANAGPGSVAIGGLSQASQVDAVAIGISAQATSSYAYALGNNALAGGPGQSQTAVGTGSKATMQSATALGDNATAAGIGSLALGGGDSNAAAGASAYGTKDIALGAGAQAGVNGSQVGNNIAMGNGAQATGGSSISLGTGNVLSGANSGALGGANTVAGTSSYAVGNNNTVANDNVFVLGSGVTTSQDNSVVLGNASTDRAAVAVTGATIRGTAYTYAGPAAAANGVVSVGAVGRERQVINVAAGRVSADSTDAINGSQLYATNSAVESISTTANKGWNLTAQGANGSNVAPGGSVDLKNTDGNLVVGKSTDSNAVNFDLAKDIKVGSVTAGNTVVNDAGVRIGNDVTLGSTGLVLGNGPSVTTAGIDAGAKKITNVAAGTADTDAVNVSQLTDTVASSKTHYYSVNDGGTQGGNYANDGATGANALAAGVGAQAGGEGALAVGAEAVAGADHSVAIGSGAQASTANSIALGANATTEQATGVNSATIGDTTYQGFAGSQPVGVASVGSEGGERQVTHVAAGRITATSTDAVNGSELYVVADQLQGLGGDVTNLSHQVDQNGTDISHLQNGTDGYFQVNNTDAKPKPVVTGANAAAGGAGSVASGNDSLAVGTDARSTGNGSVALGAHSVADRDDSVSVGSAGNERQITHVAPGTAGTDAVNVNQLNAGVGQANQYTDRRFNRLHHDLNKVKHNAYAGIASAIAMASMPQAYTPGKSLVSAGAGTYQGQSAFAAGVSHLSDNGQWVTKLGATGNTRGQFGAGVGVGFEF